MSHAIRTDLATRARYAQGGGVHRIIPAAVARPRDSRELDDALAWAAARGLPITARGAGSSMGGGALGEGLVLDLTTFQATAACQLDAGAHRAVVAPCLSLGSLDEAARPHGLRLGPDPSSAAWATVGGVIGTNAAGPRSYRAGAMDRWVDALTLHTADGPLHLVRGGPADPGHPVVQRFTRDVLPMLARDQAAIERRWPRTRKNSLGYGLDRYWRSGDLLDLVIGSEGTLGVVTGATLRLEPVPAHQAGLRIELASRDLLPHVLEMLEEWQPVAIELLDRSFLGVVDRGDPGVAAMLLVEFEADDPRALVARVRSCGDRVASLAHQVDAARDRAERAELWAIRHAASPVLAGIRDGRRSLQVVEDGCVPVAQLARYLDAVESACREGAVDVVIFGHAGDGHVHVNLLPDLTVPDWLSRVGAILDRVTEAVIALGGTPAGEHGVGRLRAPLVERVLGPEALAAFRAIRQAFDPSGRWNPGVIVPEGHPALSRLKVGDQAAPLPPGVADALQRIEEERRWGESRWDGA